MRLKITEAAEFLESELAGGEKPSKEIIELARKTGISEKTFIRVRRLIGERARKTVNGGWMLSLSEKFDMSGIPAVEYGENREIRQISDDWVSVVTFDNCSGNPVLHIKVGAYEFEADADFPAQKLTEILRDLGGG